MQKQVNARFWIWWNDGPVKLTMKPGDYFDMAHYTPTDEGWSREIRTYEHIGDRIYRYVIDEGRDCDGYTSSTCESKAMIADLPKPAARTISPDANWGGRLMIDNPVQWEEIRSRARDEYAERAGY